MLAIAFLIAFMLYFALSINIAKWGANIAAEKGLSRKKWGTLVFIFMMGLVFWDWLPMEVLYEYECSTNAGLFVEKELEAWKKENPGVWETLDPEKLPEKYFDKVEWGWKKDKDMYYRLPNNTQLIARYDVAGKYMWTDMLVGDGVDRQWLNQRFYYEKMKTKILFHIYKRESKIIDYKTKKIIVRHIDYATDIPPIGLIDDKLSDFKFWMQKKSCELSGRNSYQMFTSLMNKMSYGGR